MKQGIPPFGVGDEDHRRRQHGGLRERHGVRRGSRCAVRRCGKLLQGMGAEQFDAEGWFDTPATFATIDANGYMQITDRAKDVIKSGGEWILHRPGKPRRRPPDVAEAAVIGIAHPKWDERPLLIIVPKKDREPTKEAILAFMDGKIAKWWMPDDVVFVPEIRTRRPAKSKKRHCATNSRPIGSRMLRCMSIFDHSAEDSWSQRAIASVLDTDASELDHGLREPQASMKLSYIVGRLGRPTLNMGYNGRAVMEPKDANHARPPPPGRPTRWGFSWCRRFSLIAFTSLLEVLRSPTM